MMSWKDVEGDYYVYIWLERKDGEVLPFYVGMGRSENRWKDRSSRSKTFKEYIKNRDVFSMKVITGVCCGFAEECERRLQEEIKNRGFVTVDAEYDKEETQERQRAGIDAMPVVNGRRISAKTGRPTGRPACGANIDEYRVRVASGEVTVVDACKELGISRQTWYRLAKNA